jgi:hypothetical protein
MKQSEHNNIIMNDECNAEQWRTLLERCKTKLFVQLWLQERSVYYFDWCNNVFAYSIILISSASSATLFSSTTSYVQYIVGTMSMVCGILTAVSRQMKPAERYQEHCITAERYQVLISKIDTYLSKPRSVEHDDSKFMTEVEFEINQLVASSLKPPAWVRRQFRKKYGNINTMLYGKEILDLMMKDTLASKYLKAIKSNIQESKIVTFKDVNSVYIQMKELSKIKNGDMI